MTNDLLEELSAWYAAQTDGDWEHGWGVRINTLDNPGWAFDADLEGTALAGCAFSAINVTRSDTDWYVCRVENNRFHGWGGARNLSDLVAAFLAWAHESH